MTAEAGPTGSFFDSVYRATAPWDVGQAQPALMALVEEFPPADPVLDVGCGTGDLSLDLARRGLSVVGVDLAESAVAQAQSKASQAETAIRERVNFRVGNALHLDQISATVRTVMDSGFFHLFGANERKEFVQQLATKLPIGGRYYLLGFAIQPQIPNAPRQVSAGELRMLFGAEQGWRILTLRPAVFLTLRGNIPAVAACFERTSLEP